MQYKLSLLSDRLSWCHSVCVQITLILAPKITLNNVQVTFKHGPSVQECSDKAIQIGQREAVNAAFRVRYYPGFQAFARGLGMYPPCIKGGYCIEISRQSGLFNFFVL